MQLHAHMEGGDNTRHQLSDYLETQLLFFILSWQECQMISVVVNLQYFVLPGFAAFSHCSSEIKTSEKGH